MLLGYRRIEKSSNYLQKVTHLLARRTISLIIIFCLSSSGGRDQNGAVSAEQDCKIECNGNNRVPFIPLDYFKEMLPPSDPEGKRPDQL